AAGAPRSADDLRAMAPRELDALLTEHGHRLVTGYDLDSLPLIEMPDLIVRLATQRPNDGAGPDSGDEALARLRSLVPEADHPRLEVLVGDARATFGVRDDNGALTGAWPMGLLRR